MSTRVKKTSTKEYDVDKNRPSKLSLLSPSGKPIQKNQFQSAALWLHGAWVRLIRANNMYHKYGKIELRGRPTLDAKAISELIKQLKYEMSVLVEVYDRARLGRKGFYNPSTQSPLIVSDTLIGFFADLPETTLGEIFRLNYTPSELASIERNGEAVLNTIIYKNSKIVAKQTNDYESRKSDVEPKARLPDVAPFIFPKPMESRHAITDAGFVVTNALRSLRDGISSRNMLNDLFAIYIRKMNLLEKYSGPNATTTTPGIVPDSRMVDYFTAEVMGAGEGQSARYLQVIQQILRFHTSTAENIEKSQIPVNERNSKLATHNDYITNQNGKLVVFYEEQRDLRETITAFKEASKSEKAQKVKDEKRSMRGPTTSRR